MSIKHFAFLTILIIGFSACKEDDPFEYPEDPVDVQPTWITEMDWNVASSENWKPEQQSDGCDPNLNIFNLAAYELNYSRGFATMQLAPSDSLCSVSVALESKIEDDEISEVDWDELVFEYTYSEYNGDSTTEYIISLNYKNVELDLNLAPVISELIPNDTTDGLFKMSFENDEPIFELNGKPFEPDFSSESGNYFSINGSGASNFIRIYLGSTLSPISSYTAFQYIRISRFGIE